MYHRPSSLPFLRDRLLSLTNFLPVPEQGVRGFCQRLTNSQANKKHTQNIQNTPHTHKNIIISHSMQLLPLSNTLSLCRYHYVECYNYILLLPSTLYLYHSFLYHRSAPSLNASNTPFLHQHHFITHLNIAWYHHLFIFRPLPLPPPFINCTSSFVISFRYNIIFPPPLLSAID